MVIETKMDFGEGDYANVIAALIEEIKKSSHLPKALLTKKNGITINGKKWYGSIKPYAMRTDKNGYPHFLVCIDGVWGWVSAKHFTVY